MNTTSSPLSSPLTRAVPELRLPVELCETVIDFVAGSGDVKTLCACALTCHSWAPRSRLYLYKSITLRTLSDLDAVVSRLKFAPALWSRIKTLVIDVRGDPAHQRWAFAVPMRLAPMIRNLERLRLDSVDLSLAYGDFYKGLLLWQGISQLTLVDIQYTRHFQLVHPVSAIVPENVFIQRRAGNNFHTPEHRTPGGGQFHPPLRALSLDSVYLTLPWKEICRIVQDITFPRNALRLPESLYLCCTDLVWAGTGPSCRLADFRPSVDAVLRQISRHKLYNGNFAIHFCAVQCEVDLLFHRTSATTLFSLFISDDRVFAGSYSVSSEEFLSLPVTQRPQHRKQLQVVAVSLPVLVDILTSWSWFRPSEVSLNLRFCEDSLGNMGNTYFAGNYRGDIPMYELRVEDLWDKSKWKELDDALSLPVYAHLEWVEISHESPRECMPDDYDCILDLFEEFLPRLFARGLLCTPFDGERCLCMYHR